MRDTGSDGGEYEGWPSGMYRHIVTLKLTDVPELFASETSVSFNVTTRRYIPEDSKQNSFK
jgi:hypothetical protein